MVTVITHFFCQVNLHSKYVCCNNKIVFKFLWIGQDRVVRTAIIRIKSLRFWNSSTFISLIRVEKVVQWWRSWLEVVSCDYDPKDFNISNVFCVELIKFWADFRHVFSDANLSWETWKTTSSWNVGYNLLRPENSANNLPFNFHFTRVFCEARPSNLEVHHFLQ